MREHLDGVRGPRRALIVTKGASLSNIISQLDGLPRFSWIRVDRLTLAEHLLETLPFALVVVDSRCINANVVDSLKSLTPRRRLAVQAVVIPKGDVSLACGLLRADPSWCVIEYPPSAQSAAAILSNALENAGESTSGERPEAMEGVGDGLDIRMIIDAAATAWRLTPLQCVVARAELLGLLDKELACVLECSQRRVQQQRGEVVRKSRWKTRRQLPLAMMVELGRQRGVNGMVAAGLVKPGA